MNKDLPLWPEAASTVAGSTDALYIFLWAITLLFSLGIFFAIVIFAIRYRQSARRTYSPDMKAHPAVESTWIVIPFMISMFLFGWGAKLYFEQQRAPANTLDIYVVGKQWMWKVRHPGGQQEINELHIPVGQPVKLIMTSQDVLHSFFVPEFRLKQDVVPGMYTTMWFEATKPGTYYLFCTEYCGTSHAEMGGHVYVMEPHEYQDWLAAREEVAAASAGGELFTKMRCVDCHREDDRARAPSLKGFFGRETVLADGRTLIADEDYFRESIYEPAAKVHAGFTPVMPTFKGLLTELDVIALMDYVRGLGDAGGAKGSPATTTGDSAQNPVTDGARPPTTPRGDLPSPPNETAPVEGGVQ
jgi:cytochrome c oxidase subunit 2